MNKLAIWLLVSLAAACSSNDDDRGSGAVPVRPAPIVIAPDPVVTPLVDVPGGTWRPLFQGKADETPTSVAAFRIERHAVTNAQFRDFVGSQPQWRRSQVSALFADEGYLAQWSGDLEPGADRLDRPVTNVSWFAARAYAEWCGRRLPTVAEWELVAAASETAGNGRDEPGFNQRILDWYGRPTPLLPDPVCSTFVDVYGAWDMHGLVWEWVDDFNSALVSGESRGDSGLERDLFCGAGSIGSADPADYAAFMRYAFRSSLGGSYIVANLGFRCAADARPRVEDR